MPSLKDLLSDSSDTQALKDIQKKAGHTKKQIEPIKRPMLFIPPFVALDLETTGLDFKNDRVTEIGAVLFENGSIVREYSTLVNPGQPIPPAIIELTGITNEAVAQAPPFADVAGKLLEFIGQLPLCGHQIDFDINFLKEELKRIKIDKLENRQFDTALLARLTMPLLPYHNLKVVTTALNISHVNAHRALDDARASGLAAVTLVPRLLDIPYVVREKMASFAPSSMVKWLIVKSLEGPFKGHAGAKKSPPQNRSFQKLENPEKISPIDGAQINALFTPQGGLGRLWKDYYQRPAQVAMAQTIAETLNQASASVIEAGPGTGKSLAYLVPAAFFALANNCRVLVATYTRNLQDQLLQQDLPRVRQATGDSLRFSALKGRSNYLCLSRWNAMLQGAFANISPRERAGMLPLIAWAEATETGDIEEQNLLNRKWFGRIWSMISAENYECRPKSCPQAGTCFFMRARQQALSSHIVVINHALFYSELNSGTSFLGEVGPIIFDEAHHLVPCGHRMLRVEIDSNRIHAVLDMLTEFEKRSRTVPALSKPTEQLKMLTKQLRHAWEDVFKELDAWTLSLAAGGREYTVGYDSSTLEKFTAVRFFLTAVAELGDLFHTLGQDVVLAGGKEQAAPGAAEASERTPGSEIVYCKNQLSQLKADYDYLTAAATPEHVFWCEGNHEKGWVKLCGVPLDIAGMLGEYWHSRRGGMVFTSATLSISGSLDYFIANTGLPPDTQGLVLPSHMGAHQALRCAMRSAPEPDAPGYPQYVAEALDTLSRTFGKNMLVLFTANTMMNAVYGFLKNAPPMQGRTILAQNITGARHTLVNQLKASQNVILMGTDSFWEGIDAPGEACEIVVIPRLPFSVPTHPLTLAIAKRFEERNGDSFFSYTIPEAVIRFKQGAGRLLRRNDDRGVLVVLDNRIVTKGYGKKFTRSLDGEFTAFSSVAEMVAGMQGFFENKSSGPVLAVTESRYVSFDDL